VGRKEGGLAFLLIDTALGSAPTMAAPTENSPTGPPADGASEAAASPPAARARGFRFLGEDKSVHKALGGGKSMALSLPILILDFSSSSNLVTCLNRNSLSSVLIHRRKFTLLILNCTGAVLDISRRVVGEHELHRNREKRHVGERNRRC
jgi:hypothetical protein